MQGSVGKCVAGWMCGLVCVPSLIDDTRPSNSLLPPKLSYKVIAYTSGNHRGLASGCCPTTMTTMTNHHDDRVFLTHSFIDLLIMTLVGACGVLVGFRVVASSVSPPPPLRPAPDGGGGQLPEGEGRGQLPTGDPDGGGGRPLRGPRPVPRHGPWPGQGQGAQHRHRAHLRLCQAHGGPPRFVVGLDSHSATQSEEAEFNRKTTTVFFLARLFDWNVYLKIPVTCVQNTQILASSIFFLQYLRFR